MRHAAGQIDHDHRLVRAANPLLLFGAQQLRQAEPPHRQAAYLEKAAARGAIAIAVLGSEQREHTGRFLRPLARRGDAAEAH